MAVNVINCVKMAGHQTIVLTNERIDQAKIQKLFGTNVSADTEMIFPLELFQATDLHNIYTDFIRTKHLRSKCDVVIDTYSNALLPSVDLTYIHFPFFGHVQAQRANADITKRIKDTYYLPYRYYEKREAQNRKRVVFGNSMYTMNAIRKFAGATPTLLYPPITKSFFNHSNAQERTNTVVSVARISPEKRFTLIPQIAELTDRRIHFLIVGIKESAKELSRILELIKTNKVSDRVKIMTDVPREELQNILRTSKVFLHPAVGEHFGVSIVEAMASGCITITHNSGGPTEFVPAQYRFDELEEAARKIEGAVLEWTLESSHKFVQIAQAFSEQQFSKKFLEVFDSHIHSAR